jgi:hypothetical protein
LVTARGDSVGGLSVRIDKLFNGLQRNVAIEQTLRPCHLRAPTQLTMHATSCEIATLTLRTRPVAFIYEQLVHRWRAQAQGFPERNSRALLESNLWDETPRDHSPRADGCSRRPNDIGQGHRMTDFACLGKRGLQDAATNSGY